MKKINLKNYKVKTIQDEEIPYNVRESIVGILLNPASKLNAVALLENNSIAKRILDEKSEFILLENHDYNILKKALDAIEGYSKNDVELVERIINALEVNVKETKPGSGKFIEKKK